MNLHLFQLEDKTERRYYPANNLVLDRENTPKRPVKGLGPHFRCRRCVNQLDSDSNLIGGFVNTSLQHILNSEFPRNGVLLNRLAFVSERGVTSDYK